MQILKYPDPQLKKKTNPVDKISQEIFSLVEDMIETMLKSDGLGLAANQVGSDHKIFVINIAPSEEPPKPITLINPEVLSKDGAQCEEEGCLSFPLLYLKINRPQEIRIHAKDLYNEDFVLEATGVLARAVMHELDHLNGVLFIEYADKIEEEKVKKYLENLPHPEV